MKAIKIEFLDLDDNLRRATNRLDERFARYNDNMRELLRTHRVYTAHFDTLKEN